MNIKKVLALLVSISICTAQATSIKLPSFVFVQSLLTTFSQASKQFVFASANTSKALYSYIRNHKVKSALALASGLIAAHPKTRKSVTQYTRYLAGGICAYLGRICHSLGLINIVLELQPIQPAQPLQAAQPIQGNQPVAAAQGSETQPKELAQPVQPAQHIRSNSNVKTIQDPSDAGTRDKKICESLALHWAIEQRAAKAALRLIADHHNLEIQNNLQETALHLAAFSGQIEIVKALIAAGANVSARDASQRTALHWASLNGHLDVVNVLVDANADQVSAKDEDQRTALDLASLTKQQTVIDYLTGKHAGNM
jgi:hypothetical protein